MLEVLPLYRRVAMLVQPGEDLTVAQRHEHGWFKQRVRVKAAQRWAVAISINQTSCAYSGDLNRDMDIVGSIARLLVMSALPSKLVEIAYP